MAARLILAVFAALLVLIPACRSEVESELPEPVKLTLVQTARIGQTDQVLALLQEGADANEIDETGNSALGAAVLGGHPATVKALLTAGADVNTRLLKQGWTVLMTAAGGGQTEIVKALLEAGADVNAKNQEGWSALMSAMFAEHAEVVELLRQAGAQE